MHCLKFLLSAATLTLTTAALPNARHALEKRERTHPAWALVGRAAPEAVVPVRIGLTQSNLDEGARVFNDITNFSSPHYGIWWTPDQISDFFAPSERNFQLVHTWLIEAGVDTARISQSLNKQWVQFDASIAELETLLDTQYNEYEHQDGRLIPACDKYYVPTQISQAIDYITPGVNLGRFTGRSTKHNKAKLRSRQLLTEELSSSPTAYREQLASSNDALNICNASAVTPACVMALYNITAGTTATPGNELGLFETFFVNDTNHYSQTDLDYFFKSFYPAIPAGTHPKEDSIDGAGDSGGPPSSVGINPESDLDIQVAYPIIWPQNSVIFEVGDSYYTSTSLEIYNRYFDGFVDDFLYSIDGSYCNNASFGVNNTNPEDPSYPDLHAGGYKQQPLCGVYKAPNVLSTSYGDSELNVATNFLQRQCLEYMKLGMQGVSVIEASGDSGVDCDANDNRIFSPGTPGTCPFVTSVGATTIALDRSIDDQQMATTNFGSGGGFSNVFARPAYQAQAVENYLSLHPPPFAGYSTLLNQSVGANSGVFNRVGRAFPDLAVVGQSIAGYRGGKFGTFDGTSASAPLFAAMLTRINEVRLQQGKSTVGFVNPVLYAHPELFTDVTIGNNTNSGKDPPCVPSSPGFSAAPGWDPVTGLGTPKFQAMLDFWTQ